MRGGGKSVMRRLRSGWTADGDKLYSIKVEPEAQAIIDKYRGRKRLLCIADRWTTHQQFGKQRRRLPD